MVLYANTILAFIFTVALLPTDKSKVDLPTYTSLKVVKIMYDFSSTQENNLFGDGYYGKVVRVDESDMKNFINNLKHIDWGKHQWTKGSLMKYKLHLEILEYIQKCIKQAVGDKEFKRLNKAIDVKKLKQNINIYHKIECQRSDDGSIRDAEIWILIPEKNIVCILSLHT